MKTDSLFYRLFQTLPQLLFDLIAQPAVDAARYRFGLAGGGDLPEPGA